MKNKSLFFLLTVFIGSFSFGGQKVDDGTRYDRPAFEAIEDGINALDYGNPFQEKNNKIIGVPAAKAVLRELLLGIDHRLLLANQVGTQHQALMTSSAKLIQFSSSIEPSDKDNDLEVMQIRNLKRIAEKVRTDLTKRGGYLFVEE